jgi:tRNA threonylcarbamoyladenosine biosynthesis protein TsaB
MYLYIDTTYQVNIGLLSGDYHFLDFLNIKSNKASQIIHTNIHEMLEKHSIKLKDIKRLFLISGPGSYTGMRVGMGIANILEDEGIEVFSIRHFEIPRLLGHEKGVWVGKAFKGEFFLYQWSGEDISKKLVKEAYVNLVGEQVFGHVPEDIEPFVASDKLILTSDIIKEKSEQLFDLMFEKKIKEGVYYYREEDQEFKRS